MKNKDNKRRTGLIRTSWTKTGEPTLSDLKRHFIPGKDDLLQKSRPRKLLPVMQRH